MQSRTESSTYFAKPNIKAAIAEYLDRIIEGYKNTLHHDIIATYRARAFYKTEDILDENGNLQPNIPEELKCVIDGMELKPTTVGSGENAETMFVRKYTLANRDKALEMLTKYMALIKDRIELSGSVEITEHPVAAQLKLLRESIEKK